MAIIGLLGSAFGAVTDTLALATLCAGLVAFLIARQTVLPERRDLPVLVLSLLALCALGQIPGLYGDQGLYYLQAVQWAKTEAPLGLARLHGRLGFNSSWFIVAAVMETPWLDGHSSYVISILPILFGVAAVAASWRHIRNGDWSFSNLLVAGMAVPLCFACQALGSMSPDAVIWLITYFVLVLWAIALDTGYDFTPIAVAASALSAFAFTVKPSALPLMLGSAAILLARRRWMGGRWRTLVVLIAIALLAPWVARGIVTSGCLLYPVAASCLPLEWAVLPTDAQVMADWIASWARRPYELPSAVLGNWRWFGPWIAMSLVQPTMVGPVLLFLAGAVSMRRWRSVGGRFWWPFIVAWIGTVFWFVTAPDPRFGLGFLLAIALWPVAMALAAHAADENGGIRFRLRFSHVATACCVILFASLNLWIAQFRHPGTFRLVSWPSLPESQITTRLTTSGQRVNVPVGTDRCWQAPLPCAPNGTPGLSLLGPYELVGNETEPSLTLR